MHGTRSSTLDVTRHESVSGDVRSDRHSLGTVFVCTGKDCASKQTEKLCSVLGSFGDVLRVGCQKICDGPVAGVNVAGVLTWFERLDSATAQAALVQEIVEPHVQLSAALRKRRVAKRTGRLRTK